MMKKIYFVIGLALFLIIVFAYQNIFFTFYQQDEWWTVGHILTEPVWGFVSHFSPLGLIAGGGRPLSVPIQYLLYSSPFFEVKQFAVFAISLHFLNTVLLFLIVKKMTRNISFSFIATLFFATASVSSQAVVWIGANTTTLPSAFFALLSIYLYNFFLKNEKNKFLYASLGFAIVAYLFKDSAVFLFVLLPIMYVLFSKKKTPIQALIKTHAILIGYAGVAIFIKLFELFSVLNIKTTSNVAGNNDSVVRLLFHFVLYPFESLSQMFFYPGNIFSIAEYVGKINYPRIWETPLAPVATETIGGELVSIVLSAFLLVVLSIIYMLFKQGRKILIFAISLTFLSFLPYIVLEKGSSFLESRYFYIGVAGGGILLAIIFDFLRSVLVQQAKMSIRWASIFLLIPILLYTYGHIASIRTDLAKQVLIASERKNFLTNLKRLRPSLQNKPIFYVTGDTDYYISNHKVPFQQGMGYTLMVSYYDSGEIDKELLQQSFLWGILEQGYKEIDGKGFGYFWDIDELKREVTLKNLNKNSIVGLYYESKNQILKDITNETIKRVSNE